MHNFAKYTQSTILYSHQPCVRFLFLPASPTGYVIKFLDDQSQGDIDQHKQQKTETDLEDQTSGEQMGREMPTQHREILFDGGSCLMIAGPSWEVMGSLLLEVFKEGPDGHSVESGIDVCAFVCMLSHVQLFATPWTVVCQAPLSMEFFRQEHWRGLPFPTPGDLPHPGIELAIPCVSCIGRQILYLCTTGGSMWYRRLQQLGFWIKDF